MRQVNRWSSGRKTGATPCAAVAATAVLTLLSGCAGAAEPSERPVRVTVLAPETWHVPGTLIESFESHHNVEVVFRQVAPDSAALAGRVTGGDEPAGDVVVGLYDTDVPQVLGALEPYTSPEVNKGAQRYALDRQQRVTAVDASYVCVNVDLAWYKAVKLDPPETFRDLADKRYRDQLVVPSPLHSEEGTAFLLATAAEFGGGKDAFWSKLKGNGARVVQGWQDAYEGEFSGGKGEGTRPLVVSSSSSPITEAGDAEPRTSVLSDTCYRRARYAGVLEGSTKSAQAGKVVDFLLSQQFQESLPEQMGTYPVRERVPLPDDWDKVAPEPVEALTLPGDQVRLKEWRAGWRAVMGG